MPFSYNWLSLLFEILMCLIYVGMGVTKSVGAKYREYLDNGHNVE